MESEDKNVISDNNKKGLANIAKQKDEEKKDKETLREESGHKSGSKEENEMEQWIY